MSERDYEDGYRRGLEASAQYREEARAYKEAYFKLCEQLASLEALRLHPQIVLAQPAQQELLRQALEAFDNPAGMAELCGVMEKIREALHEQS